MAFRWRTSFYKLLPGWLVSERDGERFQYTVNRVRDAFVERARQALENRFPTRVIDERALAYIGRDRLMPRGIDETADKYARRLVGFRGIDGHLTRGNGVTLAMQLRNFLPVTGQTDEVTIVITPQYADVITLVYGAAGIVSLTHTPQGIPHGPDWGRFTIDVSGYPDFPQDVHFYGHPDLWGGEYGDNGYVYGLGNANLYVSGIKQLVKFWKMSGTICTGITLEGTNIPL